MKRLLLIFLCLFVFCLPLVYAQSLLVEAESFDQPGGWVVDPQFVEQMGSPYLMAHGMGTPVKNAFTQVKFKDKGKYHVWVRSEERRVGKERRLRWLTED